MAAKVGVTVAEAQENATKHKASKTVTIHGTTVTEIQTNATDNSLYT